MDETFVGRGYNRAAHAYGAARELCLGELTQLRTFAARVPSGGLILDVGCGTGLVAGMLEGMGHRIIGIDLSTAMLHEARSGYPALSLARMSMTHLGLPDGTFDGLWSSYAVFHVPRQQHAAVFREFRRVLRPDSPMAVSVGVTEWEGVEPFHGVDMYWSSFDAAASTTLVRDAGFTVETTEVLGHRSTEEHCWIQASSGPAA